MSSSLVPGDDSPSDGESTLPELVSVSEFCQPLYLEEGEGVLLNMARYRRQTIT